MNAATRRERVFFAHEEHDGGEVEMGAVWGGVTPVLCSAAFDVLKIHDELQPYQWLACAGNLSLRNFFGWALSCRFGGLF